MSMILLYIYIGITALLFLGLVIYLIIDLIRYKILPRWKYYGYKEDPWENM